MLIAPLFTPDPQVSHAVVQLRRTDKQSASRGPGGAILQKERNQTHRNTYGRITFI